MNPLFEHQALLTRRRFFGRSAVGIGAAALATLLNAKAQVAGRPQHAAKARRVIYLFQNGAPTHVDLFDYKPKLTAWRGKEIPPEIQGGRRLSTMTSGQTSKPVLPEITKFSRHGHSG